MLKTLLNSIQEFNFEFDEKPALSYQFSFEPSPRAAWAQPELHGDVGLENANESENMWNFENDWIYNLQPSGLEIFDGFNNFNQLNYWHDDNFEMEKDFSNALIKHNNQLEISKSQQTSVIDTHVQNSEAVQDLCFNSTPQIYTKSGNLKKKAGRKPANTGMNKRKDVVLKTVLRKIRNLMRKDFLRHSEYFKIKRDNRLRNLKVLLSDYRITLCISLSLSKLPQNWRNFGHLHFSFFNYFFRKWFKLT